MAPWSKAAPAQGASWHEGRATLWRHTMTDDLLHAITAHVGTPTYVYDLDAIEARVTMLRQRLPGALLRFALKANSNVDVLRHLAMLGVGAEVITLGELARATRAGIAAEDIILGGPGQPAYLVAAGASAGVGNVSLDSDGQWALWRDVGLSLAAGSNIVAPPVGTAGLDQRRFLVRVNPGLDPHTHEHLATGAAGSKFGLPVDAARRLAREVEAAGVLGGFHVHAGSMIREPSVFEEVGAVLESLYLAFPTATLVDLGGGFAVPDFPLDEFAGCVTAVASRFGATLMLEPGRFLVATAGVLLTRVLHVKQGSPNHVITDAGMADLLRPALYGAEHPIRTLKASPDRPASLFDVDGPLCENADRLGRGRVLPNVVPGDVLVVEQAGAYGYGMASNYASSLRPAEVVVKGARWRLSRRREEPADLWRLEDEASVWEE